jgi:hypothetical protein
MRYAFHWEKIDEDIGNKIVTWRSKVFGGWVLKTETWHDNGGCSESSVFIPDLEHKWNLQDYQE